MYKKRCNKYVQVDELIQINSTVKSTSNLPEKDSQGCHGTVELPLIVQVFHLCVKMLIRIVNMIQAKCAKVESLSHCDPAKCWSQ